VRRFLRVVAPLVPRHRRAEWLEEWEAEVDALAHLHAEGRGDGYPGWVSFVAGSLPHALSTKAEEWTMDGILQDLRFAVRVFRRAPGFTVVAALTLALGIGANASIFSLVNGLILRPPAGIREPDRLVQVARSYDQAPRWDNWSWPALKLIEREARSLSGVAGYETRTFVLGRGADTEQVTGQLVSGAYFDVLGVRPFLGRLLGPSDDVTPGGHPVVVLSHGVWVRRFGGDPGIVGRTIAVGAQPYEVGLRSSRGRKRWARLPPCGSPPCRAPPSGGCSPSTSGDGAGSTWWAGCGTGCPSRRRAAPWTW